MKIVNMKMLQFLESDVGLVICALVLAGCVWGAISSKEGTARRRASWFSLGLAVSFTSASLGLVIGRRYFDASDVLRIGVATLFTGTAGFVLALLWSGLWLGLRKTPRASATNGLRGDEESP
ncbi:MAG: hypothetical protein FWD17_03925 [Polyangiaceae bacterium]|nr:hypothetical protein [Polyangiaceae bacterium]